MQLADCELVRPYSVLESILVSVAIALEEEMKYTR
jgi:hypothetical protein